jgi:hypothetical protein
MSQRKGDMFDGEETEMLKLHKKSFIPVKKCFPAFYG